MIKQHMRAIRSGSRTQAGRKPHSQSGFGLVEMMVGVVIALMASLAIFQTFAVSEEQRRTTTSGSEGLQAGTLAFNQLKRIVQNAGYGIMTPTDVAIKRPARTVVPGTPSTITNATAIAQEFLMGCTTPAGLRVAPVIATSVAAGNVSDTLTIMQGSSPSGPIPTKLSSVTPAGTIDVTVKSTYGFQVNDWALIYEQDSASNPANTRPVPCTFARVISTPDSPALRVDARIRLSTGTAVNYTADARVVNLGQNPQAMMVSVVNNRLQVVNLALPGGVAQVLADNVIAMKVQMGIDVSNDDIVDEWIAPPAAANTWLNPPNTPVNPAVDPLPVAVAPRSLNQIKALRIGLLIRSPQFERPNRTTNTCDVTGAGPFQVLPAVAGDAAQRLAAMPATAPYNLAGNDRCYRYNTVSGVIPLRNMIMSDL